MNIEVRFLYQSKRFLEQKTGRMMFVVRNKIRDLLESEAANAAASGNSSPGGDPAAPASSVVAATIPGEKSEESPSASASAKIEPVREPAYWRQHLENIREMRSQRNAPVDSMGAEACADIDASNSTRRFQILIALMLSSQTKDEITSNAMKKLKNAGGCTPSTIAKTSQENLAELIYPVGFYKRKAEFIKKVADILIEKYNGDIPSTYDELCSLPGVGPKMATLTMNLAWKQTSGVGVDTHVHRISNRLGWTLSTTKKPEETQKALQKWLPNDLWDDINLLFVGFGQQICTPMNPKCEDCLNQNICPYALRN